MVFLTFSLVEKRKRKIAVCVCFRSLNGSLCIRLELSRNDILKSPPISGLDKQFWLTLLRYVGLVCCGLPGNSPWPCCPYLKKVGDGWAHYRTTKLRELLASLGTEYKPGLSRQLSNLVQDQSWNFLLTLLAWSLVFLLKSTSQFRGFQSERDQ